MNMLWIRTAFLGACLSWMTIADCANGLSFGSESAQDAFKDERVVALLQAALGGDAKEAKRLVASGVNVNTMGEAGATPLLWALADRNVTAVKILLDLGADPNEYKPGEIGVESIGPPVWITAGAGQIQTLQLLLEHGGDPNQVFGNDNALMMAIGGSHLDCAELLLKHGADINWSNGPESAFFMTMVDDQFGDALWVLNHGYTHDLPMARKFVVTTKPRPGQEELKAQVLKIVDTLVAAQQK